MHVKSVLPSIWKGKTWNNRALFSWTTLISWKTWWGRHTFCTGLAILLRFLGFYHKSIILIQDRYNFLFAETTRGHICLPEAIEPGQLRTYENSLFSAAMFLKNSFIDSYFYLSRLPQQKSGCCLRQRRILELEYEKAPSRRVPFQRWHYQHVFQVAGT